MVDLQQSLQRCAQARQFLKSAKAMKGSKALVVKALDLYEQVLSDHGQELPEPYFGLGYIAFAGGRPDLAVPFLQNGLQLAPGHERMRNLLQRAQRASQKLAEQPKPPEAAASQAAAVPDGPPPNELVSDLGPEQNADKISQGPEVDMLQRALQKLGHSLLLTAVYDRPTYTAVRSVQSLYKLPVTGFVDAATREKLNPVVRVVLAEQAALDAMLNIVAWFARAIGQELNEFMRQMSAELLELMLHLVQEFPEEVEAHLTEPDPPPRPREALISRLGNMGQMGIVSKGLEVFRVQQVLKKLGYPVKVNEQFDLQTFTEMSRFQLDHKLPISGIVEGATRDKLNELLLPIFDEEKAREDLLSELRAFQRELDLKRWPLLESQREALMDVLMAMLISGKMPEIPALIAPYFQLQAELGPANRPGKVSQGREVRLLQQVLRAMGYKLEINGSYDNETYAAVRSFQISKKLPMTGMVDPKSREELNAMLVMVLGRSES